MPNSLKRKLLVEAFSAAHLQYLDITTIVVDTHAIAIVEFDSVVVGKTLQGF
jgi:hypothetical protein